MDDALRNLAREAGLAIDWIDAAGRPQRVSPDSLRAILKALGLTGTTAAEIAETRARLEGATKGARDFITAEVGKPIDVTGSANEGGAELLLEAGGTTPVRLKRRSERVFAPPIAEPGYHRLRLGNNEITLAVAPPRCVTLHDIAPGRKLYGMAVQLYSLRHGADDGFGDCAALRDFVAGASREGADTVALSPTHGLFAADPAHYGPYSPSSRLFLNPLFADPVAVFGNERVAAAKRGAGDVASFGGALIDWPRAASAKYALLQRLYDDFASTDLAAGPSPLAADFRAFVQQGGERLREHAMFEALHAHWLSAPGPKWSWRDWPAAWRSPDAPGVRQFADEHPSAVQFHEFLQWITARSFAAVQKGARESGMRIGLFSDLAVGMNSGGSHAWSRQHDLLLGLSIGAPPDLINARGQDWGLTGFSPQALAASGFEPFIATLRAALRHAGGVRIDHVMGLARLWLVPHGASATEGAYLAYPLDDLLRLTALESHRHNAIVIGEDLGTVEPAFRRRLAAAGIAGMDVLWFQRRGRAFLLPRRWRSDAVAMTTTHDLPTIAGWWSGTDIETRVALDLAPDKGGEQNERKKDRVALWRAFRNAGAAREDQPAPENTGPVADAAISYTAQSPAPLALIPVEDVLGLREQPNLPGTINEHPNWRRRMPEPASKMLDAPQVRARLKTLRER